MPRASKAYQLTCKATGSQHRGTDTAGSRPQALLPDFHHLIPPAQHILRFFKPSFFVGDPPPAPSQQSFQQPRIRKHSRCRNCSMTNIFHSQLNPNQQVSAELLARTSSQHWLLQQVNRFWIWIILGYLAVTGTTNTLSLSAAGWAQSREQQASAPAPPPAWFTAAHVLSSLNRHLIEICLVQTVQHWNISDEIGIPADTGFKTLLLKHKSSIYSE